MPDDTPETGVPTPTPETPPSPAPTPSPEPTPEGVRELGTEERVKVAGTELTGAELASRLSEVEEGRKYREHARRLMTADESLPWPQREESMRFIMASEGWDADSIDQYISASREYAEDPKMQTPSDPTAQPPPAPQGSGGDNQAEWEGRMAAMEQRVNQYELEDMRRGLDQAVAGQLDSHEKIRVLLNKMKDLQGSEGLDQGRKNLQADIERQTLDLMRHRKAKGERFEARWFAEEASRAADAVFERFRSVIGDPDKIQRAPDTLAEEHTLRRASGGQTKI
jgi:hypothetical protein